MPRGGGRASPRVAWIRPVSRLSREPTVAGAAHACYITVSDRPHAVPGSRRNRAPHGDAPALRQPTRRTATSPIPGTSTGVPPKRSRPVCVRSASAKATSSRSIPKPGWSSTWPISGIMTNGSIAAAMYPSYPAAGPDPHHRILRRARRLRRRPEDAASRCAPHPSRTGFCSPAKPKEPSLSMRCASWAARPWPADAGLLDRIRGERLALRHRHSLPDQRRHRRTEDGAGHPPVRRRQHRYGSRRAADRARRIPPSPFCPRPTSRSAWSWSFFPCAAACRSRSSRAC